VKVAPKTVPVCRDGCGEDLVKWKAQYCYGYGNEEVHVSCDKCGRTMAAEEFLYHCQKGKAHPHASGYDLCLACGEQQLRFDELMGSQNLKLERDERYPIRVTLQFYKSTSNGMIDDEIVRVIKTQIDASMKRADFVGSLVVDPHAKKRPVFPDLPDHKEPPLIVEDGKESRVLLNAVLEKLKLTQYRANFEANLIYDNHLRLMGKDEVKELIPELGPRMSFWRWVENYQQAEKGKDQQGNDFMKGLF